VPPDEQAGWSFVMRCGQDNIIVAAKTLHAAEQVLGICSGS
jgi:hypothetical protein